VATLPAPDAAWPARGAPAGRAVAGPGPDARRTGRVAHFRNPDPTFEELQRTLEFIFVGSTSLELLQHFRIDFRGARKQNGSQLTRARNKSLSRYETKPDFSSLRETVKEVRMNLILKIKWEVAVSRQWPDERDFTGEQEYGAVTSLDASQTREEFCLRSLLRIFASPVNTK